MVFVQADLDAINAAIASGALSVTLDGRTVTYRSVDDLLKAKQAIAGEIAPRPKQTLIVASKGFC